MRQFCVSYYRGNTRADFMFEAKNAKEALDLAHAKYRKGDLDESFEPCDHFRRSLEQILIVDKWTNDEFHWQSEEYRLREAAPKLLAALRNLLGDLPPVRAGVCHCCGRDYRGEDPVPDGECSSDDCPDTIARAAIAEAEDATKQPAAA
jgi:hypothetical protein